MKIEIGESLIYSWLRHVKQCHITQMNWKVSNSWDFKNTNSFNDIMQSINTIFNQPFGQTKNIKSLFKQSEVDVIGCDFNNKIVYGVDIAFHNYGLNYSDNIQNITKKIFRTVLILEAIFEKDYKKEVIFATPKVRPKEYSQLITRLKEIKIFLNEKNFKTKVSFVANQEFYDQILAPTLKLAEDISDTSELFLRGHQLTELFKSSLNTSVNVASFEESTQGNSRKNSNVKIGQLVKDEFELLFKNDILKDYQLEELLNAEYSKKVFNLNYPVLKKINQNIDRSSQREINGSARYYIKEYNNEYLLCNDWYERNRSAFEKWLVTLKQ